MATSESTGLLNKREWHAKFWILGSKFFLQSIVIKYLQVNLVALYDYALHKLSWRVTGQINKFKMALSTEYGLALMSQLRCWSIKTETLRGRGEFVGGVRNLGLALNIH